MVNQDDIKDFIEAQLSCWSLAKKNYDDLSLVRRRYVQTGDLRTGIQWNPSRIVSTGADVDPETIRKRRCFLCRSNRPEEQMIYPVLPGWEMLVNPFPIFPVHLTIAAKDHRPQDRVPEDIVTLAVNMPGMAVFFNGAHAGASAPDHMHMQSVLKDEIPLIHLAEKFHSSDSTGVMLSTEMGDALPYFFVSGVVAPDESGLKTLATGLNLGGLSEDGTLTDTTLVNTFFWTDRTGMLRFLVIPRRAHRPSCYHTKGEGRRLISPGCIDMGGLIIVPMENDYNNLTEDEILKIYSEVAITPDSLHG